MKKLDKRATNRKLEIINERIDGYDTYFLDVTWLDDGVKTRRNISSSCNYEKMLKQKSELNMHLNKTKESE